MICRFVISNDRVHSLGLIPVFLGIGILIYFNTDNSLVLSQIIYIFLFSITCFLVAKKYLEHKIIWMIFFILMLTIIGYGSIFIRVNNIKTAQFNVQKLEGKIIAEVEEIEVRGDEKKLLLNNIKFINRPDVSQLERVKLVVRTKTKNIEKNDRIIVNANLMPPPEAVLPGSFDYARYAFFQEIGAIGYATGNINIIAKGNPENLSLIAKVKMAVFNSFYANMESKYAAIATALFLGDSKKLIITPMKKLESRELPTCLQFQECTLHL